MKTKSDLNGDVENPAETSGSAILDIHGVPIDPIWAAEFRGFFWGEGTIGIYHQSANNAWVVRAGIGLREDDEPVLRAFQDRLGGTIYYEHYKKYPDRRIARWNVRDTAGCRRLAHLLDGGSGLPFVKARQLELWRRALDMRFALSPKSRYDYTDEQRKFLAEASAEMRRLKGWTK